MRMLEKYDIVGEAFVVVFVYWFPLLEGERGEAGVLEGRGI